LARMRPRKALVLNHARSRTYALRIGTGHPAPSAFMQAGLSSLCRATGEPGGRRRPAASFSPWNAGIPTLRLKCTSPREIRHSTCHFGRRNFLRHSRKEDGHGADTE
jgi:hypothetical protein